MVHLEKEFQQEVPNRILIEILEFEVSEEEIIFNIFEELLLEL